MKDAKGHGSDPRGAHSAGIQALTPSVRPKPGPVEHLSEHQTNRNFPLSIPGLSMSRSQISANKYWSLNHDASGKHVFDWSGAPMHAKDSDMLNAVENAMGAHRDVDWTKSADKLGVSADKGRAIYSTLSSVAKKEAYGSHYQLKNKG